MGEEKGAGRMFSAPVPGFLGSELEQDPPQRTVAGLQLCLLSQMHSLASAVHKRLRHLLGSTEVTPISIICLFIVVSFASSNRGLVAGPREQGVSAEERKKPGRQMRATLAAGEHQKSRAF